MTKRHRAHEGSHTMRSHETVDWCMNDPPHKVILLDCALTHAGVCILYPGGTKWIAGVDFGTH